MIWSFIQFNERGYLPEDEMTSLQLVSNAGIFICWKWSLICIQKNRTKFAFKSSKMSWSQVYWIYLILALKTDKKKWMSIRNHKRILLLFMLIQSFLTMVFFRLQSKYILLLLFVITIELFYIVWKTIQSFTNIT